MTVTWYKMKRTNGHDMDRHLYMDSSDRKSFLAERKGQNGMGKHCDSSPLFQRSTILNIRCLNTNP